MSGEDSVSWESAVLVGGPAEGVRVRVVGRPPVLQVTFPCELEAAADAVRVDALYVYRRDVRQPADGEELTYGFDGASP
ncbi:hypothetical protein EES41_36055 [Streptomyces sp. ADI95-16]|uniref:hypothetical protein n=1 Tax=Streptomyces sp. ADI95-16 TaxID=1522758 RepID=UPI000F3A9533|nr:hypothetical protein [Streptomyces sp. ADI95-16]AYV32172.1 hypothetical protein EES41_36055 [Streptomyces sp. ADI95-16]